MSNNECIQFPMFACVRVCVTRFCVFVRGLLGLGGVGCLRYGWDCSRTSYDWNAAHYLQPPGAARLKCSRAQLSNQWLGARWPGAPGVATIQQHLAQALVGGEKVPRPGSSGQAPS